MTPAIPHHRNLTSVWVAALTLLLPLSGCFRSQGGVAEGNRLQILHRGIGPEPADLDPHLATQSTDQAILSALFEGLVGEDPVDLHPVPGAAEAWDVSPDGLVYTFRLRPNARWSDGTAVTAQDFVASWHRALSPALGAENATLLYVVQGAEAFNRGLSDFAQVGVTSPDPRTLRVVLEHPAPYFLNLLSNPICYPVPLPVLLRYGSDSERTNGWARPGRLVGNGPFVLTGWKHGQQIAVAKSPTYWDAANVRLEQVRFHTNDSLDAEERAFRAGQLHLTEAIPPAKIDVYRRQTPGLLRIDPLLGTYFYRLNVARPGLNDPRIRRALALSVDREGIVGRLLGGGQKPADSFTPPGLGGYRPEPSQHADLDVARRLLAAAGHPDGAGLPVFRLLYNSSDLHRTIAEAVQEAWRRDLGIRIELVAMDLNGVLQARRSGAFDILRSSWIADYADPSAFLDVWRSDSGNNFTGWASPQYDNTLFQAARTLEPADRNALYAKAEERLLDEAPIIPLFHYTHAFAIQPSVHGWFPTPLDHHPYKAVWLGD